MRYKYKKVLKAERLFAPKKKRMQDVEWLRR